MNPGVVSPMPAGRTQEFAGGFIRSLRHGNTQSISERLRYLFGNSGIPPAHEDRSDRSNIWIETRVQAPFNAAQKRLGRRQVVLAGEEERDVDRHTRKDGFLNRRQPFLGSWN